MKWLIFDIGWDKIFFFVVYIVFTMFNFSNGSVLYNFCCSRLIINYERNYIFTSATLWLLKDSTCIWGKILTCLKLHVVLFIKVKIDFFVFKVQAWSIPNYKEKSLRQDNNMWVLNNLMEEKNSVNQYEMNKCVAVYSLRLQTLQLMSPLFDSIIVSKDKIL